MPHSRGSRRHRRYRRAEREETNTQDRYQSHNHSRPNHSAWEATGSPSSDYRIGPYPPRAHQQSRERRRSDSQIVHNQRGCPDYVYKERIRQLLTACTIVSGDLERLKQQIENVQPDEEEMRWEPTLNQYIFVAPEPSTMSTDGSDQTVNSGAVHTGKEQQQQQQNASSSNPPATGDAAAQQPGQNATTNAAPPPPSKSPPSTASSSTLCSEQNLPPSSQPFGNFRQYQSPFLRSPFTSCLGDPVTGSWTDPAGCLRIFQGGGPPNLAARTPTSI